MLRRILKFQVISIRHSCHRYASFNEKRDRFGGVMIDLTADDVSPNDFTPYLQNRVCELSTDKTCPALWVRLSISQGSLLKACSANGLKFHHAEDETAVLSRWLGDGESRMPRFATHQVGIAAVLLDEKNNLLMVKEKSKKFKGWKFPTGLVDLDENFGDAASREVLEETGVSTAFESVLSFRHQTQHPTAFGRNDILVTCRMKLLSSTIRTCSHEISECDWVSIREFLASGDIPQYSKAVLKLVNHGLKHGWESVDLVEQALPAVYSGKIFRFYSRHLSDT